jgi:hypothetical protein
VVKAGLRSLPFGGIVGCSMLLRVAVLCAGVLGAGAAFAEELGPEQARAFVAGKLFAYSCFDGTVGMGRILDDGSVIGTIRPGGRGEMRFATLPPNTLKVESGSICAHLSGLPIEPCFRVQKIDYKSFRGSVSGFGFAYCDFQQHNPRAQLITHSPASAAEAAPTPSVAPRRPMPIATLSAPTTPPTASAAPGRPTPITTLSTPATAPTPPVAPERPTPIATLRPAIED